MESGGTMTLILAKARRPVREGAKTVPALSNPRHELFAQVLAAGCSATEAYVKAGYRLNKGNAGRLKTNEHIRKRVEELQARNVAAQQAAMGITIGPAHLYPAA